MQSQELTRPARVVLDHEAGAVAQLPQPACPAESTPPHRSVRPLRSARSVQRVLGVVVLALASASAALLWTAVLAVAVPAGVLFAAADGLLKLSRPLRPR